MDAAWKGIGVDDVDDLVLITTATSAHVLLRDFIFDFAKNDVDDGLSGLPHTLECANL